MGVFEWVMSACRLSSTTFRTLLSLVKIYHYPLLPIITYVAPTPLLTRASVLNDK